MFRSVCRRARRRGTQTQEPLTLQGQVPGGTGALAPGTTCCAPTFWESLAEYVNDGRRSAVPKDLGELERFSTKGRLGGWHSQRPEHCCVGARGIKWTHLKDLILIGSRTSRLSATPHTLRKLRSGDDALMQRLFQKWSGAMTGVNVQPLDGGGRTESRPPPLEFFAAAGLVCLDLVPSRSCVWANHIGRHKEQGYIANFGDSEFRLGDIAKVEVA